MISIASKSLGSKQFSAPVAAVSRILGWGKASGHTHRDSALGAAKTRERAW